MKVDVYKIDGTLSEEKVELSDSVFAIEPNDHVVYLSVKLFWQIRDREPIRLRSEVK